MLSWPVIFHAWLALLPSFTAAQQSDLTVDLGYGTYRGVRNATTRLNVWRGIRYAAPPTGELRWQAPQKPAKDRTAVVTASTFGPACPQSMPSFSASSTTFIAGNEDCLFLNVYAPEVPATNGARGLPVFVSIHGGGYGLGDGKTDMSGLINANDNSFVAVVIQYRLGAFGFLASPEVKARGVLNAGLLDQRLAFEWVQEHISKFGGDPERVTIGGESAGAGSVMLHAVAQDGGLGSKLFKNIIAASPWVPTQPSFNDPGPTRHYSDLARAVGCSSSDRIFDCLVEADSLALQRASNRVSSTAPTPYGNWAFIPVTDGTYITSVPSILLQKGKVNGLRALIGNNANEGVVLVPSNIVSQADLTSWIRTNFASLSAQNVTNLLAAYPSSSGPVNAREPKYETSGYGPGTAVNVSQAATGQQQRAYNMYAEASVNCFSYWFSTAFSSSGHSAYHYQYSVPFASHGADLTAYYGPPTENQGPDLVMAFRRIYGNFITKDNPSISAAIANGPSSRSTTSPASDWPAWTAENPMQINLNQTGGVPYTAYAPSGAAVTQFRMPGLTNSITVADANKWEGGRGSRCEFWRTLSPFVPQ